MSYTILCRAHWNSCHSNSWYTCNNFCTAAASELETAHLTQCWNYMPVTLWGIAMCLKLSSSKLQFCSPCPWHIFNSLLKLFFLNIIHSMISEPCACFFSSHLQIHPVIYLLSMPTFSSTATESHHSRNALPPPATATPLHPPPALALGLDIYNSSFIWHLQSCSLFPTAVAHFTG